MLYEDDNNVAAFTINKMIEKLSRKAWGEGERGVEGARTPGHLFSAPPDSVTGTHWTLTYHAVLKHFTYIHYLFVTATLPILNMRTSRHKKLGNLLQITQLVNGRAGRWTEQYDSGVPACDGDITLPLGYHNSENWIFHLCFKNEEAEIQRDSKLAQSPPIHVRSAQFKRKSVWWQNSYTFHCTAGAACILCSLLLTGLVEDDSLFSMLSIFLSYTIDYQAVMFPRKNFSCLFPNTEIRFPDNQSSLSWLHPTNTGLLSAGCRTPYRMLGKQKEPDKPGLWSVQSPYWKHRPLCMEGRPGNKSPKPQTLRNWHSFLLNVEEQLGVTPPETQRSLY